MIVEVDQLARSFGLPSLELFGLLRAGGIPFRFVPGDRRSVDVDGDDLRSFAATLPRPSILPVSVTLGRNGRRLLGRSIVAMVR